jgi:heparosan-N-sulfate-glucuronate 5-epimerase
MLKKLNKIHFMLRRFIKDLCKPLTFQIQDPKRMKNKKLEEYYLLFDENDMQQQKGGQKSFEFDKDGIPIVPSYIDVDDNEFHYYPITIGQYGLSLFHSYLKNKTSENLKHFLKIADWFMENKSTSEKLGDYWLTYTKKPEYRIDGPWKSAFSQSRAISILLRAFQETKKHEYLDTAINSTKIYSISSDSGGVCTYYDKNILFEEYTANFNIGVLDGAFFSMYGLFDLIRVRPELDDVKELLSDGVSGLINLLPRYDLGYWIKYSLTEAEFYPNPDPATRGYYYLILTQLQILHYLTGNEEFHIFYKKFLNYDRPINIYKMYKNKYAALKKMNRL